MTRVFNEALASHGVTVVGVQEDKKRGLVAQLTKPDGVDEAAVKDIMSGFTNPWDWAA